jgi:hypothetical protein
LSVVQAPSTFATNVTLGEPSQGRQWARNFHPAWTRFGWIATAPHWVLTVTPVESIETNRITDAGSPDCAMSNWAAQVGSGACFAGACFAIAGAATPAASDAAIHTIREERLRMPPP